MTTQDRDPGKIAQGFPSRAQGIMASLRDFHLSVTEGYDPAKDPTYVANNPESEAAMRAEANSGKTSRRSPTRPSAATRQSLTGVRENIGQQGWMEAPTALPHFCFPPDVYPSGCGEGSQWRCRCDAVWRAAGLTWEEYPRTPTRTEALLKPERWFYVGGGQLPEAEYQYQEGFYDWRPLGPYYMKLYRAMLDALQGKASQDWREMG